MMPEEPAVRVGDGRESEALLRHLEEDVLHRRLRVDPRDLVPSMHQVLDPQEPPPELPPRMKNGEVVDGEATLLQEGHGEGVAQSEGGRGGSGGGEAQRAGLGADGNVEVDVGSLGEAGAGLSGHGYERRGQSLHLGNEGKDLRRLTAVADREHDVTLHDAPRSPWMASAG